MTKHIDIDYRASKKIDKMIATVKAAGLTEAAELFSDVYWGWLRTVSAYVNGHPYLSHPEPGMTPKSAMHIVTYTINHWGPKIPGTPKIDDEAVLREAEDDEAWHREEDRRMRRDAGEEFI